MTTSDEAMTGPDHSDEIQNFRDLLRKYNKEISQKPLSELVNQPERFARFSAESDGLLLDFSRVHVDPRIMEALWGLAKHCGIEVHRERLFQGEHVNLTEDRPAMHMALRNRALGAELEGSDALAESMDRMMQCAGDLHAGRLPENDTSHAAGKVRHIIHIGIGGSLLGTRLLCDVFGPPAGDAPSVHFLGSVDAHSREHLLATLNPEEVAVVLVSKSFTTADTLMHGARIRSWMEATLGGPSTAARFFAVTGAGEKAGELGIPESQVFFLPDWVGGRYSLWSPVSLSAAALAGPAVFARLLEGGASMDRHFRTAPWRQNLPVLMALLGVWHRNFCAYASWGVIPYDERLRRLPAHLQQLAMESLGKSVATDGKRASWETAPVVFGEPGTDAQHSLFQAMHQGTDKVPLNLVGVIRPDHDDTEAHAELLANMLAQASALATGRSAEETARSLGQAANADALLAHRTFEGDRPTELLLLDELSPANLGRLLALYEHKVFVESVIWNINAFDQWGVELGKSLAPGIRRSLQGEAGPEPALADLVAYIRNRQ